MPKVRIVEGPKKGQVVDLKPGPNVIGRTDDAHISLPSTQVSRKHACLTLSEGRVFIEDLKSSNGTYVNGARIQKVEIRQGNRIQVGEYGLEVVGDRDLQAPPGKGKPPRRRGKGRPPRPGAAPQSEMAPSQAKENVPLFWRLYTPLKVIPWPVQMFVLIATVGVVMIFGVISPLLTNTEESISEEALKRASAVVGALAMKNAEFIKTRNDIYYDTQSFLENEGVAEAYLLNRDLVVLSPPSQRNRVKRNALTNQVQSKREDVILEETKVDDDGRSGTYHLATPIRVWSTDSGRYDVVGYAYIVFRADQVGVAATGKVGQMGAYGTLVVFILAIALVFIVLLTSKPIAALRDDAELALRGDIGEVTSRARFKALENLAHTLNRAFNKMRNASTSTAEIARPQEVAQAVPLAGLAAAQGRGGDDLGDAKVEAIAAAVSQGVLILDDMQRVVFVNEGMSRILGRATAGVQGRHVMEAVTEPALLGTVLDLFKQIITAPGSVASQEVPLGGGTVKVVVSGVLNKSQELKYAAVVIG